MWNYCCLHPCFSSIVMMFLCVNMFMCVYVCWGIRTVWSTLKSDKCNSDSLQPFVCTVENSYCSTVYQVEKEISSPLFLSSSQLLFFFFFKNLKHILSPPPSPLSIFFVLCKMQWNVLGPLTRCAYQHYVNAAVVHCHQTVLYREHPKLVQ